MRLNKLIFPLLLGTFYTHAEQQELPEVLDFYPECEYRVIKEVSRRNALPANNRSVSSEEKQTAKRKLIENIRLVARDYVADAIILTGSRSMLEREQFSSNKTKIKLKNFMRAELLDLDGCINKDGHVPTPFDKNGIKQRLQSGKVDLQHSVSFVVDNGKERKTPAVDNNVVATDTGVYGAALGSSSESIRVQFGTPMLEYQLDPDTLLLGFGRSLWLVFRNNKLVSAGNVNRWFSRDLVNFIPFDPRFDNKKWNVQGMVSKGMPVAEAQIKTNASLHQDKELLLVSHDDVELAMFYTGYIEEETRVVQQVRAFELRRPNQESYYLDDKQLDGRVSEQLAIYLKDGTSEGLTTTYLKSKPLGSIWLNKLSNMLIYSGNMMAVAKGEHITKLHFVENVFERSYFSPSEPWEFARAKQGQSMQSLAELLGEQIFTYDDQLQVSADKYNKNLYFDNKTGEYRLYAADVSIY